MEKRRCKMNLPICMAAVLLCLTMLTTSMLSGFYARYSTTVSGSDSARTAALVLEVDGMETLVALDMIKVPGDEAKVEFTVSDGSGASEVSQSYTVEIRELGSLPLRYTLQNTEPAKDANVNGSALLEVKDGVFQAGNVNGKQTYTLKVEWPAETKDPQYAGGVASLCVRVTAEQIID